MGENCHANLSYPLPEGFRKNLQEESARELAELTRQWEDKITELIAVRRDEAASMYNDAFEDHLHCMKQSEEELNRSLRSISARGEAKLATIHRQLLETQLRRRLNEVRLSDGYKAVIENLIAESAVSIDRLHHYEAPEPEASLLRELTGAVVLPLADDCWGGFICVDEGGTILDCTFQTRWERLRASRFPEENIAGNEL